MSQERLLPHIPSPLLVAAGKTLPDANLCTDPEREVQLLVTIRYERMSNHRRISNHFWTACEAELQVAGEGGWVALEPGKSAGGLGSVGGGRGPD